MATAKTELAPRMSDAAVRAKTGKIWREWFALLDEAGAKEMSHKEIARYLSEAQGVGPWWCQMVTVTYEQQSGRRLTHEKHDGFQISVSRTIGVPLGRLYKSFATDRARKAWWGANEVHVRKATPNKSMRVTWSDQKTSLEIGFYSKGAGKSLVVVQHSKLASASAAARMKTFWGKALDRLRELLEK